MGNSALTNVFRRVETFLKQPFQSDMNATRWFFFLGFLMLIAILWNDVLRHYKIATRIESGVGVGE